MNTFFWITTILNLFLGKKLYSLKDMVLIEAGAKVHSHEMFIVYSKLFGQIHLGYSYIECVLKTNLLPLTVGMTM